MSLKIVLQDCKTATYMRCDSKWTLNFNEALNFLSARRAITFAVKELKNSFQVVQVESNELPGTVIIAISNLQWQDGSPSAFSLFTTDSPPKPMAGRALMGYFRLGSAGHRSQPGQIDGRCVGRAARFSAHGFGFCPMAELPPGA